MNHIFLDLKFDGNISIKGKSSIEGVCKDLLPCLSFKWEGSKEFTEEGDAVFTLKVVEITRSYDSSSNAILNQMKKRTKIDKACMVVVNYDSLGRDASDLGGRKIIGFEFKNGIVDDYSLEASEDGNSIELKETLKIAYSGLKVEHWSNMGKYLSVENNISSVGYELHDE